MDKNKNLDAELDEIFSKVVEIQIAPTLPKKSHLKTGTKLENCSKVSIIVYLSEPSDQKEILEVTDLKYIDNRSCITVKGISETLGIGSWIRKSELNDLKRQNRDIRFIIGGE
jgi:hypothetical protein